VSAARPPTRPAAGPPARRQRYRRRWQTTDASERNNTGPLGGPVISWFSGWVFLVAERSDGGDDVRYDELNNEEELSDSDLSSSDGDVDEDSRTAAAAALDVDGPCLAAEDDFASAVARAAELAGLTVVGSTITDCNKGQWLTITRLLDSKPLK